MPRKISNRRLFQSLDDGMIAKEDRQMRMVPVAEENGHCSRGRHKEPERREAAPMEDRWLESAVADDVKSMNAAFEKFAHLCMIVCFLLILFVLLFPYIYEK